MNARAADGEMILSPESLPWHELTPGFALKVLSAHEAQDLWSILLRVEAGGVVPAREHSDTVEWFVVEGTAEHADTGPLTVAHYIRESAGREHGAIHARTPCVMFLSGRGTTRFREGAELPPIDATRLLEER